MSLRARLLVALMVLAGAGLLVTDAVTAASLHSFLLNRVNKQLVQTRGTYVAALRDTAQRRFDPRRGAGQTSYYWPSDSYGAVIDATGAPVLVARSQASAEDGLAPPKVSSALQATVLQSDDATTVTLRSSSNTGSIRYRALVEPAADDVPGIDAQSVLVVAIPLREVDQTLRHLLLLEAGVSVLVLAVLGGVAWGAVRIGLRPLERMGETAEAIAAGDLSQRVEETDPNTEIGRFGISLNEMLSQIEKAFAERAASEDRLRRFLADASHELRTPLTSIRGYAELFRRGADKRPDDLAKAMRRIEDEAGRMGVLVEDLLLLARIDEGRPMEREPVDLTRIATDATDDARARDPEREIRLEAWPAVVVPGDRARLHQVAANLLGNAIEHTPPGTPIEVRVTAADGFAVLDVVDHGQGLAPEEAAKAFDRFFRADPSRTRASGGAGLGLAIVAAIVQGHDGTVAVQTAPGQGATFRVRLPLVAAPEAAAAFSVAAPSAAPEPAGADDIPPYVT